MSQDSGFLEKNKSNQINYKFKSLGEKIKSLKTK